MTDRKQRKEKGTSQETSPGETVHSQEEATTRQEPVVESEQSSAGRKRRRHAPGTDEASREEVEMISIPTQEYHTLQEELDQVRVQAAENMDGWRRERADFVNYKKRMERDQQIIAQQITADVVKKYLEVLDDLERSLQHRPQDGDGRAWAEGIELIYRKLLNQLQMEGIQQIPVENEFFDPLKHEAVTHEDSPDHESGAIIAVLRQGYMIGDRVIRPALVRVAR